jgi:hypothetical protein
MKLGDGPFVSKEVTFVNNTSYYLESRSRGISYVNQVNGKVTGLVTFCVLTAFYNRLSKKDKRMDRREGRRGRRRRKLLDDVKERRGYSHLKEEAVDSTMGKLALEEALDLS